MKAKFVYETLGDILKGKSEEEIMFSIKNKDLNPDELLIKSSQGGFLPGIKKALKKGADIHAQDDWSLLIASAYGHLDIVKFLIDMGANIHVRDDEPLRWASHYGHLDIVKYLINKGAKLWN